MNSDITYNDMCYKFSRKIYASCKRRIHTVMKVKWWEHWGEMGSASSTSPAFPPPLLPVHLTIRGTSSFMHYQFTPTSPGEESCPAQRCSGVQGWSSKSFIMWLLPSGLRVLQNRLREEERSEGCNEKKEGRNDREVLTCTTCASGSVLTVKDTRKKCTGQYTSHKLYHLFAGEENH